MIRKKQTLLLGLNDPKYKTAQFDWYDDPLVERQILQAVIQIWNARDALNSIVSINVMRIKSHRLNNPVSVTRGQRLNRVTSLIYRSQPIWTRWDYVRFYELFCNLSTKTTLFQTYFITLSQINSKNYHFHTFFLRSNWQSGIHMKVMPSVWAKKKPWKLSILYLIWLEIRR